MKRTFTYLVVLFGKNIEESHTIQSLIRNSQQLENELIYIWDNSSEPLIEESINLLNQNFKNLIYNHTPQNVVLSKIYNIVIAEVQHNTSYLILLDDDSDLPSSFFIEINNCITTNPTIELFLPQIYSNGVLVSPAKDYLLKTKLIANIKSGLYPSKYTTAINSGMIIKTNFFKQGFKYNEKLNFYGTDNFFMVEYKRHFENLFVLDVKISHDLSYNSSNDIIKKITIFKEIRRANKIIYGNDLLKLGLVSINNFIVAIKRCISNKTLAFFYD